MTLGYRIKPYVQQFVVHAGTTRTTSGNQINFPQTAVSLAIQNESGHSIYLYLEDQTTGILIVDQSTYFMSKGDMTLDSISFGSTGSGSVDAPVTVIAGLHS